MSDDEDDDVVCQLCEKVVYKHLRGGKSRTDKFHRGAKRSTQRHPFGICPRLALAGAGVDARGGTRTWSRTSRKRPQQPDPTSPGVAYRAAHVDEAIPN